MKLNYFIFILTFLLTATLDAQGQQIVKAELQLSPTITFECLSKQSGGGCLGADGFIKQLSGISPDMVIRITNITLDFANSLEFSNLSDQDELMIPLMHVFDKRKDNTRTKTLYLHPGTNQIRLQILHHEKEIFRNNIKVATNTNFVQ